MTRGATDAAGRADAITTRPLSPALGAEIVGLDLARPLDETAFAAVRDAFNAHGVVLFRDQRLSPERLVEFSRGFGALQVHVDPQYLLPGHPEIVVVGNLVKDGELVSLFVNKSEEWHTDHSYLARPSLGTLFYAVETPPEGGDTLFANMHAAYDALPEAIKARIAGLRAVHSFATLDAHLRTQDPTRPPPTAAQARQMPPVAHPLARTHPETGRKSLYICPEVISHVEGLPEAEGRALVAELARHATEPRFVYRHRWRDGDLVIWDNRSTLHTATPFDAERYRRVLWRTTVAGDAPF